MGIYPKYWCNWSLTSAAVRNQRPMRMCKRGNSQRLKLRGTLYLCSKVRKRPVRFNQPAESLLRPDGQGVCADDSHNWKSLVYGNLHSKPIYSNNDLDDLSSIYLIIKQWAREQLPVRLYTVPEFLRTRKYMCGTKPENIHRGGEFNHLGDIVGFVVVFNILVILICLKCLSRKGKC